MSITGQAEAIIATSGLRLVQLLRTAMQTADKTVAAHTTPAATHPAESHKVRPVHRHHHNDHFVSHHAETKHRHSATYSKPCKTPVSTASNCCPPCPATHEKTARPEHQAITLQAPWTVLPWPKHLQVREHFKKESSPPDMQSKGKLIDLFV